MSGAAATQKAATKIVVCGGNGFLGTRICQAAVSRGWDVTSISRSGEPTWSAVSSSKNAPSWSTSVNWAKADVLKPETYKPVLKGADAVIHSMGILLEADYKGVLTGKESIRGGLARAFSPTKRGSQNPLERREGEELKPQEKDGQFTYELMNRDTAITLAQEASYENVSTFVFISAAAGAPILPKRYITTKREAESAIASSLPTMRSIFMRPGFLYDSSRLFTLPIALAGTVGSMANQILGGRLSPLAGAAVEVPLKPDVLATAIVEAIENPSTKGVCDTTRIEALASAGWRRRMFK